MPSYFFPVHQRGLIKDLGFEIQNQMNPDLYNFMSKIWSGQVLIDSANDLVYQTFHGENSYGFIPFQTKQVRKMDYGFLPDLLLKELWRLPVFLVLALLHQFVRCPLPSGCVGFQS